MHKFKFLKQLESNGHLEFTTWAMNLWWFALLLSVAVLNIIQSVLSEHLLKNTNWDVWAHHVCSLF